jgi:hypothetical protein
LTTRPRKAGRSQQLFSRPCIRRQCRPLSLAQSLEMCGGECLLELHISVESPRTINETTNDDFSRASGLGLRRSRRVHQRLRFAMSIQDTISVLLSGHCRTRAPHGHPPMHAGHAGGLYAYLPLNLLKLKRAATSNLSGTYVSIRHTLRSTHFAFG